MPAGDAVVRFLKSKTGRVLAVLVLLFGIYSLAGFVLAPHLVRSLLTENVQKATGVAPQVGEIRVNPWKLQLEVRDFSLPAAGGGNLLGFEHFSINVSLAAIWRRALVFGDIVLDKPFMNVRVAPDGSVNLLQLHPKAARAAPPTAPPKQDLPRVQIGLFRVSSGTVSYNDESRSPAFSTRLEPIEFDLRDFSTGVEGGLFDFAGRTRNDERIEWHGHLSLPQLESDGQIKLTGLQAKTIWSYLESHVNFAVSSGSINIEANYRVSVKESTDLHLDLRQLEVAGLGVRPRTGDADWIGIKQLQLGPATLDLAHHDVKIDSILFKGLQLTTWLNPDRSLNLMALAALPAGTISRSPKPAPAASTAPPAAAVGPAAPSWHLALRDLAVQEARLSFEDRAVSPSAKFALAPVSLDIQGASLDLSQPVQVKLDALINAGAHLDISGSVTPAPMAAELGVQLASFDLTALQPYIGQLTAMSLKSGQLGADLKLKYGGAKPALAVKGAISVASLHTIDNALQDDFLNWDSLDLKGFSYQQQPARLEIDSIVARKLYSRTIIEADSTLNVSRVLRIAKPVAGKSAGRAAPPAPVAAVTRAPAPAAARAASPYVAIRNVQFVDGTVNFSDFSITPNFSAGIQKLNGSVNGLNSRSDSRATVDLKGEVDQFSPVSISGDVNLLSPALYADVTMNFHNIELSIINPYSGKFAGYDISKGKLSTELHYRVEGRKLDAQHHITIEQLEFGAPTDSKDAVSLPIKLAVALLKDRNGVIDLDLPVTGSLDDPKFSLMPVIAHALKEVLEKLVTAPFALLGRLLSSGPDLQFVDFQPGSAALDDAAVARLKSIAKALTERPQLKIDVPIAVVAEVDRPALAAVKFQAQLQTVQQSKGAGASRLSVLRTLNASTVGSDPKYPDDVKTDDQKAAFLESEVRRHIPVGDSELVDLGQQRALTLQSALLTGTELEPERVFLVQSDKAKAEGAMVRLEMSLH